MSFKYVSIAFTSCLLFSCSFGQNSLVHENYSPQDGIPMAGARSINANILDSELRKLTDEAQSIETQMGVLLERLNRLRGEISGYDTTIVDVIQNETIAESEPEAILPVPERVKPTVKKTMVKVKPKATVKKSPPQKKTVTAAKTPKGDGVRNVRTGLHNDKTRMVFDINGSTNHTMNFDEEAGVVTITFPETQWSSDKSKTYTLQQISGYEAKETEQGTIIAIAVRNASDVKSIALADPNRLVLDVIK